MSDIYKTARSLIDMQKYLSSYTENPFASILKEQEMLIKKLSLPIDLSKSLSKITEVPFIPADISFHTLVNDMFVNQSEITASICKSMGINIPQAYDAIKINPDLLFVDKYIKSFAVDFSKSFNTTSFETIANSITNICIEKDFVSVPKGLIPDGFQYEEVADSSVTIIEQNAEQSSNIKKLSFVNALAIISLTMTLLLWLLAPFYNNLVNDILSDNDNSTESIPYMTEEQVQQIIEYLSELTEYQQSILNTLQVSEESIRETDSCSDDTQLHFVVPDSERIENDKLPPTSADEPSRLK